MIRVLLDTNIYDRLSQDTACQNTLQKLTQSGHLEILVSPTIHAELCASPFKGVPRFFPVCYIGESVLVAGGQVGDRCGKGKVLHEHLGVSRKTKDAFIADVAAMDADYLVTEDNRLRKRLNLIQHLCEAIDFTAFVRLLNMMNI